MHSPRVAVNCRSGGMAPSSGGGCFMLRVSRKHCCPRSAEMFTTFAAEPLWRAGTPAVAPPPRHRGAPRATSAQLPGARACRGDRARETPRRDQAGRRSRNEPPGDLRRTGEPGGRDLPRDGPTHREGQLVAGFHPLKTRMTRWIRRLDRRRRGVKMPADGARADQIRSADSRCADLRVSGLSCRRREGRFADTPCTDRRLRAASAARLRVESVQTRKPNSKAATTPAGSTSSSTSETATGSPQESANARPPVGASGYTDSV
jgi:hypothetical protein